MSPSENLRMSGGFSPRRMDAFAGGFSPAASGRNGRIIERTCRLRLRGCRRLQLAALCIATLVVAVFSSDPVQAAGRTVRVGIYQNEPKIFTDSLGQASGIYIDLLTEIARQESWTLDYVICQWAECLAELESGQIDLMPDVAYSADRAKLFDFNTTPVLTSWSQLYANPRITVNGYQDLAGKRVAVLKDSIQETAFRQYMSGFGFQTTIVTTDSLDEAFQKASDGSADAAIANNFFGDYFYKRYGLLKTPLVFQPATLFFATAKGRNPDLLAAIDRRLNAWLQEPNSTYYATISRWTEAVPPPVYRVPQYVYWVFGIIGGLFVLAAGMALLLRIQVQARTRHLNQTAQALQESEQKYRELVEFANSIILRWTRDGKISFLNEFGQRFFGFSAEEIVGRSVMGTIVPSTESDGRDLGRLMEQILADPAAFEQNVNENMRRNGERVWIAWTNRIVRDARGEIAEILSIGTDITELKRAEEAVRELNAGLERRVAERTAELAVARDRAEEADRLKSAFLATMSHELRTPLNSIIGFTGVILQELAGPLNPEQHKQLEMVRGSARHLLALINDVLDISKIEAAELRVVPANFDLREAIEKVTGLVKPLAERKGIDLRIELAPEIGGFTSDARRVEQILLNLLQNAIKFTDRGSVTLKVKSGAGKLRISVADTGIGIRPEDLQKLFQPFHQVDTGLARQHEGTGLGLAISLRLADLLGGDVRAESEWGKGSVFTLTLPAEGSKPT